MALFAKFDDRARGDPAERELASIIENLNNILNTRKDYGSSLLDMGIRDLNEYTSKDHILQAVMAEVKRNIARYEPRVELVRITAEESGNIFKISFKIECRVRETAKSLRMIFDSVFNNFEVNQWN